MAAYYTAFWACSLEHFFFVLETVNELKASLSSSSIESQVTGKYKLPQAGCFSLIAVWILRLFMCQQSTCSEKVDWGDEADSWQSVRTLEPGNENTAAGANFKHRSQSDPSRS